jgi:glycosyltransferase involved in cell wall biosynthesis
MNKSGISVIIPTYNHAALLAKCLQALSNQTIKHPFEVVLVDDGSKDKTPQVALEYKEKGLNLRYIRQDNAGPAKARNNGISKSKYGFIALIDDDCVPDEDWLENGFTLLKKENLGVVEGETYTDESKITPLSHTVINKSGGNFQTCNIFIKKEIALKYPFDEGFKNAFREDSDFAFHIFENKIPWQFSRKVRVYHPVIEYKPMQYLRKNVRMKKPFWNAKLYKNHPKEFRRNFLIKGLISKDTLLFTPLILSFVLSILTITRTTSPLVIIGISVNFLIVYAFSALVYNIDQTYINLKNYSKYVSELFIFMSFFWILMITTLYYKLLGMIRYRVFLI